jgi:hypothetical protein
MRKMLAFVVAFVVGTVGLAVRVHADVLDSVTVVVGCKNYTVKATGHGLSHPNAVVQYRWDIPTGGLGTGFGDLRVADMFPANPQQGGAFTTSTTKAEPIPPSELVLFGNVIGFGSATLITGAMTWNTVAITFIGNSPTFTSTFGCPSLNRCALTQARWRHRENWPVERLVLGNPFPNPAPFVYSDDRARAILRRVNAPHDASIELAQQLIAAKLNLFNGAPRIVHTDLTPTGVAIMFLFTNDADFLLGNGRLPQHVDPASSLGQQMEADAAVLASYNTGALTTQNPDGTCQ